MTYLDDLYQQGHHEVTLTRVRISDQRQSRWHSVGRCARLPTTWRHSWKSGTSLGGLQAFKVVRVGNGVSNLVQKPLFWKSYRTGHPSCESLRRPQCIASGPGQVLAQVRHRTEAPQCSASGAKPANEMGWFGDPAGLHEPGGLLYPVWPAR